MSSVTEINLQELKVQEHQVREVLKCILHTIIFNRALGHVSPRDMDLQLVNVSYVEVDDESVDRQVNAGLQAVQDFVRVFKGRAAAPATPRAAPGLPFTVKLSFYEARTKQGIVRPYQERVFWETWRVHMRLVSDPDAASKEQHQQALTDDIDAVRTMILHHADSKTELPPVQASSPSPLTYPFVITPERQAGLADSLLGSVSRFLSGQAPSHPDILGSR